MSPPAGYVLDSNVFIEAARRYYAFDLVSSFWDALIVEARKGFVQSIDRVKAELDRGNDPLAEWSNAHFSTWFLSTNQPDVIEAYGHIVVWAQNHDQFNDAAKARFFQADNADPWVVAYARAKGLVVVTHEQQNPSVQSRIPIPNVCEAHGVHYVDTFRMLRDLGVRLG